MDIIKFNKHSDILTEKYAPTQIKDIIGAKRQVYALIEWLKKYSYNASANLKKKNNKKNGKKTRRRKSKPESKSLNVLSADGEDGGEIEDINDTVVDNDDELEPVPDSKKTKKKDANLCSCAIMTGDHGTGKTAIVRAILNDTGYQIKSVNFAKIGAIKTIDDFIENLLIGEDIYETIENVEHKKFAILVDEIQSVSTPTEKNVINGILKLNSELWACPVIFIGNNKHKKIMSLVKKDCYHISMYAPDNDNMLKLLERVGLGEAMTLENEEVAHMIIKHSQRDYRRLIVTLGELHRLHGSNVIKNTDLKKFMKFTEEKDMDRSIYENTNRLFSQYNGINSALKVFENDKTNMPLMVHQNHFLATNEYVSNKSKLTDLSSEITENMARGDVVDNYIYSDQNWSLQETHGFYTCVYPSFKLNQNIDTKRLLYDSQYPYYKPVFSSQYPKDLNRTSTRCINYKNVKFANEYFNDMSIDDYVMAVKLIKNLLEDGRVIECEKILKEYKLTAQGIMYVLKIDKINGTRKDVSKTIEKKVKEIAIEPVKAAVIKNGK
jgi:hypothetical protein